MTDSLLTFKQSPFRKGMWIGLIIVSILSMMLHVYVGEYSEAVMQLFLAFVFDWISDLEKEITRRNAVFDCKETE